MRAAIERRSATIALVGRLAGLAADVGLLPSEVERLIGVHAGVWPMSAARCELWWPTDLQSERVRALAELCVAVISLVGPDARTWLRRGNRSLGSAPARFLLSRPEALSVLRDALRGELGQC